MGPPTAWRLARVGFAGLAVGRDAAALGDVCSPVATAGATARAFVAVVRAADAPAAVAAASVSAFGGIDALVNAAGVIASGSVVDTTDEAWDAMMTLNLRAPFRLLRACAPALIARKGSVVNLSSTAGLRAFPGLASYAVSKAAVDQLTRCAALDLASHGVRVNAVNPGVVVTNLHRRGGMDEATYGAFLERSKATHPLGRPGTAEEIADLIGFLVSSASGWITGDTIAIDGGRQLTCLR
jgi:NAD(P)-dependent dehydrogenase (short-subunit alcohol dehydrogenase family)